MTQNWDRHYDSVVKYVQDGLPESGLKYFNKHIKGNISSAEDAAYIKSQVFEMLLLSYQSTSSLTLIEAAESAITNATHPISKAIWQSIAADFYSKYYQQYRYEIMGRTALNTGQSSEIEEWSENQFFEKINDLYTASLSSPTVLQSVPFAQYQAILSPAIKTAQLRPTLFDILAQKAKRFYEFKEINTIQPTHAFSVDEAAYFADRATFINIPLAKSTKDTLSSAFKTLTLYQQLLAFHQTTDNVEALLDVDLDRLQFVYNNSILSDKLLEYYKALQRIETNYLNTDGGRRAHVLRLNLLTNVSTNEAALLPVKMTKKEIEAALIQIKNTKPSSESANLADQTLRNLTQSSLNVQVENVILPLENNKLHVTYKNVEQVYFTLYRLPATVFIANRNNNQNLEKYLQANAVVKQWKAPLKQGLDLDQHSTELLLEPLELGMYLIVADQKEKRDSLKNVLGYNQFQVSNLTTVSVQENTVQQLFVLNRKDGSAVTNVKITLYDWIYDGKSKRNKQQIVKDVLSDKEGKANMGIEKNTYTNYTTVVVNGKDTLLTDFNQQYYYNDEFTNTQTLLFTDRSIYRPGQVVYFKGIVFENSNKGKTKKVKTDMPVTVILRDANYQDIKTLTLQTNEYGSYHGQFEIPEGLINGYFSISDNMGSTSFSVEEYKRPKFFTVFDKLEGSYNLNDKVIIKGKATAFAGNAIGDATVKYRVVREVRFPYRWYYYSRPSWNEESKEIVNGTIQTKTDGSFEIPFELQPDLSVDKSANPIFTYVVYADVTDINGETHTANSRLSASYQSFLISAQVPENVQLSHLQQIQVSTTNLNGEKVNEALDISIYKLEFPGIFRNRYWDKPDIHSFEEKEYRQLFPYDEYENESDPLTWKTNKTTQEWKQLLVNEKPLTIQDKYFKENGYYVMEIAGRSKDGSVIKDKKVFHLFDVALQNNPEKPLMVTTDKTKVQPAETVKLQVGTAFGKNANLLAIESNPMQTFLIKDNVRSITRKIVEGDRGGILYSYYIVNNNRAYQDAHRIEVPWDNKDLQISWATHRDKLQPGASDEWTMSITGNKKEKVATELLSVLYDASLDELKPHSYSGFANLYPSHYAHINWDARSNYRVAYYNQRNGFVNKYSIAAYEKEYAQLLTEGSYLYDDYRSLPIFDGNNVYSNIASPRHMMVPSRSAVSESADMAKEEKSANKNVAMELEAAAPGIQVTGGSGAKKAEEVNTMADASSMTGDVQVRSNFNETAYFLPQLRTNEKGDVVIKFTLPESLTKWKMMSYAHTPDMQIGLLEGSIVAQKDLMVQPNMPRFFRQNDKIVLSTKIANLTQSALQGNVQLEILDPNTMQALDLPFKNTERTKAIQIEKEGSTEVNWELDIPQARYEPVLVRIKAQAGNFTDGEEHLIPVLTNRTLVTETKPLPMRGSGVFAFTFDKLKENQSSSLLHKSFTIEYTANPAWYAVQALPYLVDYPHDCAEQTFSKLYATAISRSIVEKTPNIETVFNQWRDEDTAALLSNLEKNQELKSALLQETPWVMEAQNESQQKQLIGKLFEKKNLEKQFGRWMNRMQQLQNADGSWSWFAGMRGDDFITQYIITGFGKLKKVDAIQLKSESKASQMILDGLDFLDRSLVEEFEALKRTNKEWKKTDFVNPVMVNYFYMRSFFKDNKLSATTKEAYDFYYTIAKKKSAQMSPYQKAQMALVTFRNNEKAHADGLMRSLKETSMHDEELGMYWKNMPRGYYWYEAPVEAQSLIIEAFSEVTNDEQSVNDMKTWLLKQKQTQNWGTTKATADATYALIMKGENWLAPNPQVNITAGSLSVNLDEENTQAGTGYFKKIIEGKVVNNDFADIKVTVNQPEQAKSRVSWGAVYWQYFEDMDKISKSASPLAVAKKLFIKRNTDAGPQLFEVSSQDKLKVGDRLTVRVTIRVDRDMEYIHLKDMRAGAFEPVDVLSGYNYTNGLGFYRSVSDASMNFFFDRLNKGTYVFEYDMFVNAKGTYSNGISTIQSMYAPEFNAHTEGLRLEIE